MRALPRGVHIATPDCLETPISSTGLNTISKVNWPHILRYEKPDHRRLTILIVTVCKIKAFRVDIGSLSSGFTS